MAMGVARDLKEDICCKAEEDVKSDRVCVERELEETVGGRWSQKERRMMSGRIIMGLARRGHVHPCI